MTRKPNCYLTADSALIVGKEILLVQRKHDPFGGQWALPGGFVDPEEKTEDGALRELMEETGVTGVRMQQFRAYGDPGRDPRGRTVSVVFWARLSEKPDAHAGDDAAETGWFSLEDLPPMAFDHGQIAKDLLNHLDNS
jgi:8-oxo-dGTP diphosphatase